MNNERVIMHYDMDCFYASVEIKDRKQLEHKPVVVGSSIVTTANYPAREFGIKSAMSVKDAKNLCPNLVVIFPDKNKYHAASMSIQKLVLKITPISEFIALDEGYLDITEVVKAFKSKEIFARKFRERIFKLTGLTCSVGIGSNKLMAKIGSNSKKPYGQFIFETEKSFTDYIKDKNISIIPGVGKKFLDILNKDNIFKVSDIYNYSLNHLIKKYGNSRGSILYFFSRGIDDSKINFERETHSIGNERTLKIPIYNQDELKRELLQIYAHSFKRLKKENLKSKNIGIKIKYLNGSQITRAKSLNSPTDSDLIFRDSIEDLILKNNFSFPIKLIGVYFQNLSEQSKKQLTLF